MKPHSRWDEFRTRRGLILLLLVGLTFGVYANGLGNGFHYDDFHVITENNWIRTLSNTLLFFTSGSVLSNDPNATGYRPFLLLSYALNYAMSGLEPWGYHLLQITLHACSVLFVYGFVRQIHRNQKMAILTAVLFGLHPANTEAVNYLTARSSLMSGMFSLMAFCAYLYFRSEEENAGSRRLLAYLGSVLFFILAILTKETAIILPILFIAYDFYYRSPDQTQRVRQQVLGYIPFVLVGGFYLLVRHLLVGTIAVLPSSGADRALSLVSHIVLNLLTALKVFAQYIFILIWPVNLNVDHALSHSASILEVQAIFAIVVMGCLLAGIWLLYHRMRWLSFCSLWFVVTLLPIGILPFLTNIALFQENRGYLTSVAFAMALSWGLLKLPVQGTLRWLRNSLIMIFCVAYALAVIDRNRVWRDEEALWSDALKKNPKSVMAYLNLGYHYYRQGQWDKAAEANQGALRLVPKEPRAMNNLGMVYYQQGRLDEAEDIFRKAINDYPGDPRIHNNFGLYFSKVGRFDDAIHEYNEAIRRSPRDWRTILNLGWAYAKLNRWDRALESFQMAHRINTTSSEVFTSLGAAFNALGKIQDAQQSLERALSIDPTLLPVYQQLADLYIRQGQMPEAMKLMEKLIRLDPQNAEAHHAVGYLSEQQEKYEDALGHYREAIRIDPKRFGSYFNLANVYWRFGELDLALGAYQKSLELEPNFLNARFNMAKLFENAGKLREAIHQYQLVMDQAGSVQDLTMERQARQSLDKLAQTLKARPDQTLIPQKVQE